MLQNVCFRARIVVNTLRNTHCVSAANTGRFLSRRTYAQTVMGTNFEDKNIQKFLQDVHDLVVQDALVDGNDRNNKVLEFMQPQELELYCGRQCTYPCILVFPSQVLHNILSKPLTASSHRINPLKLLDLQIGAEPTGHGELLERCKKVIKYSVKTGHPRFHNQLYGAPNAYGISGAWVTEALNTNIHTYEVSPAFVLIEKYVIEKLCGIVGYTEGDGLFCPGGSFSNTMGVHIARYRSNPLFKENGMYNQKRMKMYTSEEAHYSLTKAAVFLGLGSQNVVKVKTDIKGRIIPEELEAKIKADVEKGEVPMFAMGTCGTTVLGGYDPLNALADVCEKYKVWLHVDACWGGGALFSKKHRYLMEGIERADSLSWNLHKMQSAPLQTSVLLLKQKGILEKVNKFNAEYLFQPDKCYDVSYDVGDKTVQCGRKVDCFKLWFLWKALGDKGFEEITDRAFDNARYFSERLKETNGFRLVIPEFECTNICFWYVPESMRGQEETPEWWEKLSKVAPKIKEGMMKDGTLMIGYNPLSVKGFVNFFRIIILNAACTHDDMDAVLKEIERIGKDL